MRTVQNVIDSLKSPNVPELKSPDFSPIPSSYGKLKLGLSVASMKDHMSNEGWQLFQGLEMAGYVIAGQGMLRLDDLPSVNLSPLLKINQPGTVVLQDKREWDVEKNKLANISETYTHLDLLKERNDIFKLTVLKDAHQSPEYHSQSAEEIDCHAWITYYHPRIVKHLAPFVRPQHLIRTTHSIDSEKVPEYNDCRLDGLLSG